MMSRLFQSVPVNLFTQISVVLFAAIFLWIVWWTYLPVRRSANERASRLPLED